MSGGGGGGGRTRRGWWKGGGRDKYSPVSVTQFLLSQHKLQKPITCCLLFLAVLADVMGHSNLLPSKTVGKWTYSQLEVCFTETTKTWTCQKRLEAS